MTVDGWLHAVLSSCSGHDATSLSGPDVTDQPPRLSSTFHHHHTDQLGHHRTTADDDNELHQHRHTAISRQVAYVDQDDYELSLRSLPVRHRCDDGCRIDNCSVTDSVHHQHTQSDCLHHGINYIHAAFATIDEDDDVTFHDALQQSSGDTAFVADTDGQHTSHKSHTVGVFTDTSHGYTSPLCNGRVAPHTSSEPSSPTSMSSTPALSSSSLRSYIQILLSAIILAVLFVICGLLVLTYVVLESNVDIALVHSVRRLPEVCEFYHEQYLPWRSWLLRYTTTSVTEQWQCVKPSTTTVSYSDVGYSSVSPPSPVALGNSSV